MPSQMEKEGGTDPVVLNLVPVVGWLWRREWVQRRVRQWRRKEKKKP